jgi:hypothetical protein
MLKDYHYFCPRNYRILAWLLIPALASALGAAAGLTMPDITGGWTVDSCLHAASSFLFLVIPVGILEILAGGKLFNGFSIFHDGEPGFLAASDRWKYLLPQILTVDAIRRFLVWLLSLACAAAVNHAMTQQSISGSADTIGGMPQTLTFVFTAALIFSVAGMLSSIAIGGLGMFYLIMIIMVLLHTFAIVLVLSACVTGHIEFLLLPAAAGLILYFRRAYFAGTAVYGTRRKKIRKKG